MPDTPPVAPEATNPTTPTETPAAPVEDRSAPPVAPVAPPQPSTLSVEDRSANDRPTGSLAERFRQRGFPGETATLPFSDFEDRASTFTVSSVDTLSQQRVQGGPLGADQRFAWPAFARIGVDAGVTSVAVVNQSARTLPSSSSVVRAIDAITSKPTVDSTLSIATLSLKQVAAVQSNLPNVYLQSPVINSIIETDLALTINTALDSLVQTALATAGFQAPGSDALLVSIRKAITTITAAGYAPDTLLLDPASAQALDVLTATSGDEFYVFGAGQFAPGSVFGLQRRISSAIAAPAVVDSTAFGRLYASPLSLAKFEEAAGSTNTSLIRLELNAQFGTERTAAAVRIASS